VSADETFTRRHKWIEHETHFHLKVWKCNLGCNQDFISTNDMRNHFTEVHGFRDHTDGHLLALSLQVQRETPKQLLCPLCHDKISSLRRYNKHVARHLEQLALFAIPRDSLEDEDIDDDVEDDLSEDNEVQVSIPSHSQDSRDGASQQGDLIVIKLPLSKDKDVNAQGGRYSSTLQAALFKGNAATVELLLSKGADVNAQGGRYGSVLQAASFKGDTAIVELLLSKGADVNAQGGQYGSALQAASFKGNTAIVKLLLSKGANVNTQGGEDGNALQAASFKDDITTIELLLSKGTDVNAQGGQYGSALQAAV
jgi:uncharacterized membrane protein (DUF2068 family)